MTSGPGPKDIDPGRVEEEWRTRALEALRFQQFQLALARRRVEDIMRADDFAMAIWVRQLTFVHEVLSDVYYLIGSVLNGPSAERED